VVFTCGTVILEKHSSHSCETRGSHPGGKKIAAGEPHAFKIGCWKVVITALILAVREID